MIVVAMDTIQCCNFHLLCHLITCSVRGVDVGGISIAYLWVEEQAYV